MANKRSISTMRPTPSEKQRGPQSLPLRMENFGGAGKPESSKHFNAEIAAFASLWSVIFGKRGLVFNSLTFSCYLAIIFCKNAEMPHFRAAFLLCIFFINTFWSEWRDLNPRPLGPELPFVAITGQNISNISIFVLFCELLYPISLHLSILKWVSSVRENGSSHREFCGKEKE